ncbi:MAG TPA: polysaccharide biosynthesis tyrosine autokinase, partial [Verrucomicrobiae bacterium]|nr:polysaccharide biosynthesis tyrosine autokinase [Verrucomicrobiae bacterium]
TPRTYMSQASLWLTARVNLPDEGAYPEEVSSYIASQAQLMKSPTIQMRAYSKIRPHYANLDGPSQPRSLADVPFDLSVRTSQKNSIVELRATGADPEATRAFLDGVIDEYFAFKKDARKRTSAGALSGITDQIHEVETGIERQQNQITMFEVSNNVSYLNEHGLSAGSHLAKLGELLSDLRTEHHLLELLTPAQFQSLAQPPGVTASDAALPGERTARNLQLNTATEQSTYYQALQQLELLKSQRERFARVLRPTHSKMVKMSQEIAGLDMWLDTLRHDGEQRARAQMENRKKSVELQIQNLETQYRDWETNAAQASTKLAQFDRMKQDLQRSQSLYDRLLSLLQTVDLRRDIDQEPLSLLAAASVGHPTLTRYGMAAAGLFLSLLVGAGAFLFLEALDDRFGSARDVSFRIPAEVIGQIPKSRSGLGGAFRRLLTGIDPQPAFAESFRSLRSVLLFMARQERKPKIILITSAIPQEGKTTVASNLAGALAASGSRVLLVDADLRRPSVHRVFGIGVEPGLAEVLSQTASLPDAVVASSDPILRLLPAGQGVDGGSDLLLKRRVDLLLRGLAGDYDYILIDSAPILATDDAASIGPHCDGVFMVLRADYTSERTAREALERLRQRRIKVLGVVYNCARPSTDFYCQDGRDYYRKNGSSRLSLPNAAA